MQTRKRYTFKKKASDIEKEFVARRGKIKKPWRDGVVKLPPNFGKFPDEI